MAFESAATSEFMRYCSPSCACASGCAREPLEERHGRALGLDRASGSAAPSVGRAGLPVPSSALRAAARAVAAGAGRRRARSAHARSGPSATGCAACAASSNTHTSKRSRESSACVAPRHVTPTSRAPRRVTHASTLSAQWRGAGTGGAAGRSARLPSASAAAVAAQLRCGRRRRGRRRRRRARRVEQRGAGYRRRVRVARDEQRRHARAAARRAARRPTSCPCRACRAWRVVRAPSAARTPRAARRERESRRRAARLRRPPVTGARVTAARWAARACTASLASRPPARVSSLGGTRSTTSARSRRAAGRARRRDRLVVGTASTPSSPAAQRLGVLRARARARPRRRASRQRRRRARARCAASSRAMSRTRPCRPAAVAVGAAAAAARAAPHAMRRRSRARRFRIDGTHRRLAQVDKAARGRERRRGGALAAAGRAGAVVDVGAHKNKVAGLERELGQRHQRRGRCAARGGAPRGDASIAAARGFVVARRGVDGLAACEHERGRARAAARLGDGRAQRPRRRCATARDGLEVDRARPLAEVREVRRSSRRARRQTRRAPEVASSPRSTAAWCSMHRARCSSARLGSSPSGRGSRAPAQPAVAAAAARRRAAAVLDRAGAGAAAASAALGRALDLERLAPRTLEARREPVAHGEERRARPRPARAARSARGAAAAARRLREVEQQPAARRAGAGGARGGGSVGAVVGAASAGRSRPSGVPRRGAARPWRAPSRRVYSDSCARCASCVHRFFLPVLSSSGTIAPRAPAPAPAPAPTAARSVASTWPLRPSSGDQTRSSVASTASTATRTGAAPGRGSRRRRARRRARARQRRRRATRRPRRKRVELRTRVRLVDVGRVEHVGAAPQHARHARARGARGVVRRGAAPRARRRRRARRDAAKRALEDLVLEVAEHGGRRAAPAAAEPELERGTPLAPERVVHVGRRHKLVRVRDEHVAPVDDDDRRAPAAGRTPSTPRAPADASTSHTTLQTSPLAARTSRSTHRAARARSRPRVAAASARAGVGRVRRRRRRVRGAHADRWRPRVSHAPTEVISYRVYSTRSTPGCLSRRPRQAHRRRRRRWRGPPRAAMKASTLE